jgi:hypothetical protein
MGRSRRAAATSSDDSDGGAAPSSDPSPGGGGRGGRKKWTPGNSGSQQKARAKELRLEQERRKAERERRNEDKRVERDRREEAGAAEARLGATPPARPPASSHSERHVGLVDAAPARRELKRLFGRVEHGGGASQRTGRAVELEHVRVIVADTGPEERRKSGAAAWSQRMRKGGEREMPLADFLALGASSPSPGASGSPVAANAAVFASSPGGDRASWNALVREPPYHLVLRVVARFDGGGGGEEEETDEETLWSVSSHHRRKGDEASSSRSDASRSDALAILPAHCWEAVATRCDARGVACLSATCAALAELSRSDVVRKAQHAALFGRPAPPAPAAALRARPHRGDASARPGSSSAGAALDPAALEALGTRRGWAATCASVLAADPWIPTRPTPEEEEEEEEEEEKEAASEASEASEASDDDGPEGAESDDDAGEDDARVDDVAFDEDDGDFAGSGANSARRRGAARGPEAPRSDRIGLLRSEASSRRFSLGARSRRLVPRPLARHEGVGPWTAHRAFANSATAVSCDWRKIKLWFHGGDGQTEPGKRIATLPHPPGVAPPTDDPGGARCWSALAAAPGYFLAGDPTGHVTVWDADSLEVTAARVAGTARADAVDDALLDPDLLDGDARGVPAGGAVRALAVLPSAHLAFACGDRSRVVRAIDLRREDANHQDGETNLNRGAPTRALLSLAGWPDEDPASDPSGGGAATLFDVEDMIVTGAVGGGAAEYHGGTPTASFAPRGFEAPRGAPTLWAASTRDGFAGVVEEVSAVDVETGQLVDRFRSPFPSRLPRRGASAAGRSALDARGNVILHATSDGRAAMYDARAGAGATRDPVATFRVPHSGGVSGGGGVARGVAAFAPGDACCALDEWAAWISRGDGAGDAVALFDARRATGPPRGDRRWHLGDELAYDEPAAWFGAGTRGGGGGGGCFTSVGCFARGGDGTLVVAPRPPPTDAPRDAREAARGGPRCSVYTSAHGGTGRDPEGGGGAEAGGDGEDGDGFALPKKKKERAKEKKTRRKYPKRQGGKFRARTAGG